MSVARFIADQTTNYRVPHTITCAGWASPCPEKARGLHGSPWLHDDLREAGWQVSEKTVADSMRRQGLVARKIRRRNELTRHLYEDGRRWMHALGLAEQWHYDLWTGMVYGLMAQQVANDPGGDRWARLVPHAVEAFLGHVRPLPT